MNRVVYITLSWVHACVCVMHKHLIVCKHGTAQVRHGTYLRSQLNSGTQHWLWFWDPAIMVTEVGQCLEHKEKTARFLYIVLQY